MSGQIPEMEDLIEWLKTLPCGANHDTFLDELTARLDAAGCQIAPKEPTQEMIQALHGLPRKLGPIMRGVSAYRAMIAAIPKVAEPAPKPPLFETRRVGNGTVTLHREFRKG